MHLIIMGAPGSGKGTCAQDLKQIFCIPHISTGDMFRKAIKEQTPLGLIAKELIDNGMFVPDDLTNKLVKERLSEPDCKNGFLLDGYPRNVAQAAVFESILKELNIELDAAIYLDIETEEIVKRIVNRRLCSKCGASYNIVTNPSKVEGICDECGSELYTRDDDNEITVRKRLEVYEEQTQPLVDYYNKLGKIVKINSNQPIECVINDIVEGLK